MSELVVDLEDSRRALEGLRPTDARDDEAYARAVWSVLAEPGDGAAGELIAAHGAAEALRVAVSAAEEALGPARARWLPRLQLEAVDA